MAAVAFDGPYAARCCFALDERFITAEGWVLLCWRWRWIVERWIVSSRLKRKLYEEGFLFYKNSFPTGL